MSPPPAQQWTRRLRYSGQHIRVSGAERNSVAGLLGQYYADGRLDQAEFDDRINRTMAAKARGDLTGLFDDLPETGPAGGPAGPGGLAGPAVPYRGPRRRGGLVRPLLLLILLFACANFVWRAFTASMFFIQPLAWAFVIVAVVLLVTRSHHRHDRGERSFWLVKTRRPWRFAAASPRSYPGSGRRAPEPGSCQRLTFLEVGQ